MSKQVTIGEFTLETSGDQIVVRDATGGIVETVAIDDLNGDLMLPTGVWVDVADLIADADIANLQTAAGGQPGAEGAPASPNGGPSTFAAFQGDNSAYSARGSAGALGSTDLSYSIPGTSGVQFHETRQAQNDIKQVQVPQAIVVTWAEHDPWQIAENHRGGVFGKVVDGNPNDFTFEVSDARFEVVDGVLRVRNGYTFDFEDEPGIDLSITATSRTGDVKTLNTHIDVTDVNEEQTSLALDSASVDENTAGAVIGNLTVSDPDAGDQQSFKVSDNRFEVVNGQLKLKDGVSLDHESEGTVDVTVTATDKGGHKISETFSIQVGNVNEAPTDIDLSGNSMVENVAGAVVGDLTVVDPDAGDSHTYAVSDDRFEVVNGQLKLKDGVALDFEGEPTLDIVVTATDAGGKSVQETFTLSVDGANEAQTALTLGGDTIKENDKGAVVGTLTVVDPDAGDKQSFEVSDNRFQVVNGELQLKGGVALDHEAEPTVSVTVTATDKGGNQISETFTINVADVNEQQTAMSLTGDTVAENAVGAVIGDLTVSDPDAGDSQSFEVSDSRFEVVNGQLKLKDGVSLDHESEGSVEVTITATDKGGNQISESFKINVGDVNEAQIGMTLTGNTVAENDKGAVIGSLNVSDPDAGDSQSFEVSDSRFEVVNGQLKLKDGVSLDHESESSVNVTVTATDGGNHQYSETFAITVGDANEASTTLALSGNTVAENDKGATIGMLSVVDADAGDKQSYEVSDSRFHVVNGELQLKGGVSFDYETEPTVDVTVTATDKGGNQVSETFKINVTDVNEAQTGMTLSGNTVAENAAGAVIGSLNVSDPDAGDSQSFEVSDNRFEVVNNQLKLKSGQSLDYEAGSSINVTVTATDQGQHQYAKTFSIGVTNVNEAQTGMSLSASTVAENNKGATIGTLTTTDPDANDSQTYTVSDNRFEVVNDQLKLKSGVSLDYEAGATVNVTVTATDQGQHQYSKSFALQVTDASEIAPVVVAHDGEVHNHFTSTTKTNLVSSSAVQPSVDFSDADSNTLSQATIHTSGFQSGDTLSVPNSSLFDVSVVHTSADYTITITGKTGAETLDQYEDFVNSISFTTTSTVTGDRHIDYSVTDSGGLTSNVDTADITVDNEFSLRTSELAHGKTTTLEGGSDTLYIDTSKFGPVDMGDGHDTVQLAQQDRGFDHNDAVKLSNIEEIDTTGYGVNKVSLSITDVLNMTDDDNQLTVIGDKGDVVTLESSGKGQWEVTGQDAEFTTYHYTDSSHEAIVQVSNQLTAQIA